MKKKIFILLFIFGCMSFASDFTGPYHEINFSAGFDSGYNALGFNIQGEYIPNWKKSLSKDWDVKLGPTTGLSLKYLQTNVGSLIFTKPHIGFTYLFDYKIPKSDIKLYVGQQIGFGIDFLIYQSPFNLSFAFMTKIRIGARLKNNLHVGGFIGFGEGVIGAEVGYTF